MAPDLLARPLVVATERHGLVEGHLHRLPPEPGSPGPHPATGDEEQQQRGGLFGQLLSQLFDQASWAGAEFDVVGTAGQLSPGGGPSRDAIRTAALAAHPTKQL
jgi:hypothetical protein